MEFQSSGPAPSPIEAEEAELIERSKRGDGEAFARLIRKYEDRIYNLARKVCAGAPAEAEDIYQETFLTAFKKIGAFRSESSLGTWLYRIAANLCWTRLRKKRREPFVPVLDLPSVGEGESRVAAELLAGDRSEDPAALARKAELRGAVTAALGELPVEVRLVVALKDIQGLSNEEIARIMKLSLPAVKSRLHRGRLFLRDRLGEFDKEKA